jgi:lysozyme family protein
MTTNQDRITEILAREGDAAVTNDSVDAGGRTQYGISERANPQAWADGKVTEQEAREIYEAKYIRGPHFDRVPDDRLRTQLIDMGVHSGPGVAIQKLQEILKVVVDGVLGPQTLAALQHRRADEVNNLLAASRIRMIGRLVSKVPTQLKFLNGWLDRACQFIE